MKLGLLISFFNETEIVQQTIQSIQDDIAWIGLVQSGDKAILPKTKLFPNLAGKVHPKEIGALSLTRNFSYLFKQAKNKSLDFDLVITGDTAIYHLRTIKKIICKMNRLNKDLACSRAIGQLFYGATSTESQIETNTTSFRFQEQWYLDFMPQFFIVRHSCVQDGLFNEIDVTNRWCSEQCLGDAFVDYYGTPVLAKKKQMVFSKDAYGLMTLPDAGIIYQAQMYSIL